jgi:UDP-N-acetylmuramate dehydrogenase
MKTISVATALSEIAGLEVGSAVPLSRLTTFRIGGPAAIVVTPQSAGALRDAVRIVREAELPALALGNGSNVVMPDAGFDGVVWWIASSLAGIEVVAPDRLRIAAGTSWAQVMRFVTAEGWHGLEFAAGIPGTIGGAVPTNAGSRGGQTSDRTVEVVGVNRAGELETLASEAVGFRYHGAELPEDFVVTEVLFAVEPGDPQRIAAVVQENLMARRRNHPEREPSAGCIFKNPPGVSAGKLIDLAGLKGEAVGGAVVSPVHGNFFVNRGGATSADVVRLIARVRERVFEEFGVELELDVRLMGCD